MSLVHPFARQRGGYGVATGWILHKVTYHVNWLTCPGKSKGRIERDEAKIPETC